MFLKLGETTFHVDVCGPDDAAVLVLLHSLGTCLQLWDAQAARLSARFRVVRIDMRGHGLSSASREPFSLDDLASDVLAILDRLGVDRFAVAGVSIGGMIAQVLAAAAPERVERAVFVDTSMVTASPSAWRQRAEIIRRKGLSPFVEEIVARWVTSGFQSDATTDVLKTMLLRTSVDGFAHCAEALAEADFSGVRDRSVPVLVVVGDQDVSTPPEAAQALAEARGGQVIVLPGAAHIPNFERADELSDAIETFLDTNSVPKTTAEAGAAA